MYYSFCYRLSVRHGWKQGSLVKMNNIFDRNYYHSRSNIVYGTDRLHV